MPMNVCMFESKPMLILRFLIFFKLGFTASHYIVKPLLVQTYKADCQVIVALTEEEST